MLKPCTVLKRLTCVILIFRYSVREKVLALSIYQRSPEVYKWFRKVFNLPSKRVLDQWLEDVALQDPQLLKKLMYYVYTTYNFKAVS